MQHPAGCLAPGEPSQQLRVGDVLLTWKSRENLGLSVESQPCHLCDLGHKSLSYSLSLDLFIYKMGTMTFTLKLKERRFPQSF